MSLSFLLDEHLPPAIEQVARTMGAVFAVRSLVAVEQGQLRGLPDDLVLQYCREHGHILVTADLATIPTTLREWADRQVDHAGVIFLSQKTMPTHDAVRLAKALLRVAEMSAGLDWTNRVVFLK